ncbi:MAG: hypothetical protein FJ267_18460 [Planctomycetes bacterium]|nr:hypothetical protein [Planctomycetota bacterium]
MTRTVDRVFAKLPCRVTHVELPCRQRDIDRVDDSDVRRIAALQRSAEGHLGILIDDDGASCSFLTERGTLVSTGQLVRLLVQLELAEYRTVNVVISSACQSSELTDWLAAHHATIHQCDDRAEAMFQTLKRVNGRLGILSRGRVWFGESAPSCDAIATLARVLQALSQSDQSFSSVLNRLNEGIHA